MKEAAGQFYSRRTHPPPSCYQRDYKADKEIKSSHHSWNTYRPSFQSNYHRICNEWIPFIWFLLLWLRKPPHRCMKWWKINKVFFVLFRFIKHKHFTLQLWVLLSAGIWRFQCKKKKGIFLCFRLLLEPLKAGPWTWTFFTIFWYFIEECNLINNLI